MSGKKDNGDNADFGKYAMAYIQHILSTKRNAMFLFAILGVKNY